jgi:hypothetical protein
LILGIHGSREVIDAQGREPVETKDNGVADVAPSLAEAEAVRVWTEHRLRALRRAAFLGNGYDPDAFDTALLTHRAAAWCATAARQRPGPHPAPMA